MSFLDDFDAALDFDLIDKAHEAIVIIDKALDDIKHQRIVDTNTVTDWLLDIRQLING